MNPLCSKSSVWLVYTNSIPGHRRSTPPSGCRLGTSQLHKFEQLTSTCSPPLSPHARSQHATWLPRDMLVPLHASNLTTLIVHPTAPKTYSPLYIVSPSLSFRGIFRYPPEIILTASCQALSWVPPLQFGFSWMGQLALHMDSYIFCPTLHSWNPHITPTA